MRFIESTQQLKKLLQAKMTTIAVSASVLLRRSFISNVSYLILHLDRSYSSTSKHNVSSFWAISSHPEEKKSIKYITFTVWIQNLWLLQEWLINNLKVSVKCQHFFEYRKKMMGCSHRVDEFTGRVQTLNKSCVSIFKVEVSVNNKQDQELIWTAKIKNFVCTG